MEKKWKLFYSGDCPNCGNDLEVYSEIPEEDDDEDGTYVFDEEEVRCVSCEFKSCITLSDYGEASIQEGNLNELNNED